MKVKTKRRICAVTSAAGFFFTYGVAGGVENNQVTLGDGTLYMIIGIAVFAAAAYKGGFLSIGR